MIEQSLVASLKMNDRKALTVAILEFCNIDATEVKEAQKITAALLNRACEGHIEGTESPEPVEMDSEPSSDDCGDGFDPIREAIVAGDKKKAKKLIKEAKAEGHKGSVLTGLKNEMKEL